VISLRRLLLVSPETPAETDRDRRPYQRARDMDQEDVARLVASYNLLAIPVVEDGNKLVGIITVDDVIDVIKDEATEDMFRLAVCLATSMCSRRRRSRSGCARVAHRQPSHGFLPPSRRPVQGHHQCVGDAGGVHVGARRHGRQRRHPDAGGDCAWHRIG
jgi:hypothetical protein